MLTFVQQSKVNSRGVPANRLERSRLDKLREELSIPPKELNKIAKEVVGREFGDVRFLSTTENRRVVSYLKKNCDELGKRYRRLRWAT